MSNLIIPNKLYCKVRYGITKDLPMLVNIDKDSYDAWTLDDFKIFKKPQENILILAEIGDPAQIIGFILVTNTENRIKVVKCCVMSLLRRKGVGTQLVDKIKSLLRGERNAASVVVRERDLNSQLFLKKNEFICTEVHQDLGEDVYVMEYFK